ncbi:MAG: HAD family hydrolase [Treponema sp.]|jgi:phosphoglycolate phosphatase|nr:HAD family hydrolase [Treponema sp.]
MKFKCIIFDLDGTLVNTIADIAGSMNRALEAHGFPPVPVQDYLTKVGWGIKRLAYLCLPAAAQQDGTADQVAEGVAADATRFYAEQPLVYSQPYPDMLDLVAALGRTTMKTAVLSNKPDPVARLVVQGLFPQGSFSLIQGDRPGLPRKPDPAATWAMLMALDRTPRETIFMGDSEIDMETAHAAGCYALGVSWGFRSRQVLEAAGADRIIDTPGELLGLISTGTSLDA